MSQPGLCIRCGAIRPPVDGGESGVGSCPECGLGYSWRRLTVGGSDTRQQLQNPSTQEVAKASRHDQERILNEWHGPLYGLDESWMGSRWVGGHGRSPERITHVELGHGDPFDLAAPMVRVRTEFAPEMPPGFAIRQGAIHLSMILWHEGAPHELVRPSFSGPDSLATWDNVSLPVSGQSVVFRCLNAERAWVAIAEMDAMVVSVFARAVQMSQVSLTQVLPRQYLE